MHKLKCPNSWNHIRLIRAFSTVICAHSSFVLHSKVIASDLVNSQIKLNFILKKSL